MKNKIAALMQGLALLACPLAAQANEPNAAAAAKTAERAIVALSPRDTAWLDKMRAYGRELLEYYAKTTELTPAHLDAAFRAWKLDRSENRAPDAIVAGGLGALFGDYVVAQRNSRWMLVKDPQRTDLAVVSPSGQEIYPVAAVWKRIDPNNGDLSFFEPIWKLLSER